MMDACTYCGVVANTVDHVVPRLMLKMAGNAGLDLSRLAHVRRWEVPSCHECNTMIGSLLFPTLKERRAYAHRGLRKKYAKFLRVPDWSDSELAKMGPVMRQEILGALQKRDSVRARLAWRGSTKTEFDDQNFGAIAEVAAKLVELEKVAKYEHA